MPETLVIVLSILGACGACGAGACKYYTDRNNRERDEIVIVQPHTELNDLAVTPPVLERHPIQRPNTPAHALEDMISAQLKERYSGGESDTEIDVNIHIHTVHSPQGQEITKK